MVQAISKQIVSLNQVMKNWNARELRVWRWRNDSGADWCVSHLTAVLGSGGWSETD